MLQRSALVAAVHRQLRKKGIYVQASFGYNKFSRPHTPGKRFWRKDQFWGDLHKPLLLSTFGHAAAERGWRRCIGS
jgi:hypothetical protein